VIFLDFFRQGTLAISEGGIKIIIGVLVDSLGEQAKALVGDFFTTSTRPEVGAAFFVGKGGAYQTVASVSCLLLVGATALGVAAAVLSGEPGQALARIVRDLAFAVLAILVFPWFVDKLVTLTDVIAYAVLPGEDSVKKIEDIVSLPPSRDIAGLMVTMMVFLAIVLIYLELVVQNALTMIVTALAPLSFAGMTMPAARPSAGQMVKMTVAIAFAKPAIFVALRIGVDLIAEDQHRLTPGGWGRYLTGMAVLGVAVFMPFVVWRLIPIAEAYAVGQGVSRAPFRGAMQVAQSAYWAQALAGRGGLGGGRSGLGGRNSGGRGNGLPQGDGPGGSGPQPPGDPGQPRSLPDPGQRRRGRRRPPENGPQQPGPAPSENGPDSNGGGGAGFSSVSAPRGRSDAGGRQTRADFPRQPVGRSANQDRAPASAGPPGPAGPAGPEGRLGPEGQEGSARSRRASAPPQAVGPGAATPPGIPGPAHRSSPAGPSSSSESGRPPGALRASRRTATPSSADDGGSARPPRTPAADGGGPAQAQPPGTPPGWRRRPRPGATPPGGAAAPPGDRLGS
jgi:hypothetical protein